MKHQSVQPIALLSIVAAAASISHAAPSAAPSAPARLTVNLSQPGARISPLLYGIFYEEINRAGDGGLYAEMIENRSFEDAQNPASWSSNGRATLSLDRSRALNAQNPTALRVEAGAGGGVINAGFKGAGLSVQAGHAYTLSFYARSDASMGPLEARLESREGALLGSARVPGIGGSWKKYTVRLASGADASHARLVIQGIGAGTFFLDQVSLMPTRTWKNTPLRADLAERVAAMKPAFVRFPGGCFVEGDRMANATRWKETVGDPAERPGHHNLWGYRSTDGLGVHEFLQWCEDLNSEPLYVINCGMAHADSVPMDRMAPLVQDALDLLEYARGPVTSTWGALRARAGHAAPFKLRYMEIGNENGGPLYHERYALFHDAIKAKYPDVQLVANVWGGTPTNRPLDIIDEHYYDNPAFFRARAGMYDAYDRKGPQIYVGEYAVTKESGRGNMAAALGEAAYMTGLERNGDIVKMASYAPLLVNPAWERWNPNAIVFDQSRSYGTPSYWTQVMFGQNRGDVVVPVQLQAPVSTSSLAGGIGVGTWATQAEFKDIRVTTPEGKLLLASDFAAPQSLNGWRLRGGDWKVAGGVLSQSSDLTGANGAQAYIGDRSWGSDYTLSLKARKTGGAEGFLISFQKPDDEGKHWWNLGGWGNVASGLEGVAADSRTDTKIETGRWYDIRVEAKAGEVKCYLDGQLIQSSAQTQSADLFVVASRTSDGKTLILKLVNTASMPMPTSIALAGAAKIAPTAQETTLSSSNPLDENTFERPSNIVPVASTVPVAGNFTRTLPANSITVLRLKIS